MPSQIRCSPPPPFLPGREVVTVPLCENPDHILHNLRHKIWWSSPIAYIPFPGGINSNSCKDLEVPCDGNEIVEDQVMKWEAPITTWYPKVKRTRAKKNAHTTKSSLFQGSYPLYWVIQDTLPNGNALEIVCTEMTIKII